MNHDFPELYKRGSQDYITINFSGVDMDDWWENIYIYKKWWSDWWIDTFGTSHDYSLWLSITNHKNWKIKPITHTGRIMATEVLAMIIYMALFKP